jgi:rhamnosyltransferase
MSQYLTTEASITSENTDRAAQRICAVIVAFNAGERILGVVDAVSPQVDRVLIIDNGSTAESVSILRYLEIRQPDSVEVVYNETNRGVGAALTQGAEYALQHEYDWLLTLDHDTLCSPHLVSGLLAARRRSPLADRVAVLAPVTYDQTRQRYIQPTVERSRLGCRVSRRFPRGSTAVHTVHTSGNLVRVEVFQHCGAYRSDYFIDCVDMEFSLRVRRHGFLIIVDEDQQVLHNLGAPMTVTFLGRDVHLVSYSPSRQYYMARNYVATLRAEPDVPFMLRYGRYLWFQLAIAVLTPTERSDRIRSLARGLLHGATARMGKASESD